MNHPRGRRLAGLLLAITVPAGWINTTHAVTIDWVTVGDTGNTADTTG